MQTEDFESTQNLEKWLLDSASLQHVDLMSPIHDAAARGNLSKLRELVTDKSCNEISKELINSLDEAKNTPLHWAAGANKIEVMTFLIDYGCLINEQNVLGDTPLHRAVWRGNLEAVKILLEKSANAIQVNKENKKPIDLARNSMIATLLIDFVNSSADTLFTWSDEENEVNEWTEESSASEAES